MNMKKAVGYIRYSTNNQTENSAEYQEAAIRDYCKRNDIELVEKFVDEAYSGTNDHRPEFQRMIKESKKKPEWGLIVVFDLSRLFRNIVLARQHKDELYDLGFKIVDVKNGMVLGGDDKYDLWEVVMDLHNDYEVKMCAERTHCGMLNKAKQAAHCGGLAPLGYDIDEDGKLCINDEEAEVVRLIFRMYNAGYSYQMMADKLNNNGYRTKVGNEFCKNSFAHILKQEKYLGTYIWNRRKAKNRKGKRNNHQEKPVEKQVILENEIPPIIEQEVFERAQKRVKDSLCGNAASKSRYVYPLGGMKLLRCGCCGRYMNGKITRSHDKAYLTYSCPNHKGKKCPTKDVSAEKLEHFVFESLLDRLVAKEGLENLNILVKKSLNSDTKKRLEGRIRGYNRSLNNLARKIEKEKLTNRMTERMEGRYRDLDSAKEAAEQELKKYLACYPEITHRNWKGIKPYLMEYFTHPNDLNLSMEEDLNRRELLQKTIDVIEIENEEVTITFKI